MGRPKKRKRSSTQQVRLTPNAPSWQLIDQKARPLLETTRAVPPRTTRPDAPKRNGGQDLSRIASAGVAKLSEYSAGRCSVPPGVHRRFNVYLDSRDISRALWLSVTAFASCTTLLVRLSSLALAGDPSSPESKARALTWAIRDEEPGSENCQKSAGEVASAARSVTAELFDLNLDEEGGSLTQRSSSATRLPST